MNRLFLPVCGCLLLAFLFMRVPACAQQTDTIAADTSLVEKFLGLFEEADAGDIPEMKRSRKQQVDELLKAILEEPGKLQFSGVATTSLQVPLVNDPTWKGVGSFDIFAYVSFGANALLFFDLEAGGGQGPDALIPNISGLNADAGGGDGKGQNLTVLEAWTEFKMFQEIFTVTFGKIDPTNYFDNNLHANDETSQFISGVFVNNPVLPVGLNSPGIHFRTTFLKRFYIQYGHFMADPDSPDIMTNHLKLLETGLKVFRGSGWEANLRVFGHEQPLANHTRGYGLSFDQLIANNFSIFARYGENSNELAGWQGIKKAWSGGIGFQKTVLQREFKIGLAYAETWAWQANDPEKLAEFYFSTQLNKWVFVTPNAQWLQSYLPEVGEHFLAGLRINFSY
ncbi:hypothetical protein [uncultured Draconibacterium sp.]|uniref:hypothetical protein n=1 Tax=uncultured Draconibacterium sp. TaxID=1573823 RepID=UPI0032603244